MPDSTYYQEIAENRNVTPPSGYHPLIMSKLECAAYAELKAREIAAQKLWTSFLYRNENKPKLSDRAKRKQQKEKMEDYERTHKARLAHEKTCQICGASTAPPALPVSSPAPEKT